MTNKTNIWKRKSRESESEKSTKMEMGLKIQQISIKFRPKYRVFRSTFDPKYSVIRSNFDPISQLLSYVYPKCREFRSNFDPKYSEFWSHFDPKYIDFRSYLTNNRLKCIHNQLELNWTKCLSRGFWIPPGCMVVWLYLLECRQHKNAGTMCSWLCLNTAKMFTDCREIGKSARRSFKCIICLLLD